MLFVDLSRSITLRGSSDTCSSQRGVLLLFSVRTYPRNRKGMGGVEIQRLKRDSPLSVEQTTSTHRDSENQVCLAL